ncbi:hypothetical protein [Photobacterium sanguinicancri]|uniref:DUF2164 domain-containing protein n=1 Tax=Photobacterium sanguinicancri TaxID=875932 RepID=A0AAW7Y3K9_9GAMM|nr:hypothetical protein [Photobacterium sanguinicancri]MDO6542941.1 hypothetical protein [Photobacterium sanguinicancri]
MIKNRIRSLIQLCRVVELNVNDEKVQACIAAVAMDVSLDVNTQGEALMNAFRSQTLPFINALKRTEEFRETMAVLSGELSVN